MMTNHTIKRLVIQALIVGVICFCLMQLVGALAINPGVGEGVGVEPQTFRYRIGLWCDSYGFVVAVVACWPVMVAEAFGLNSRSPWVWYLGFLVAGVGWVLLWHFGLRQFQEFRRVTPS